MLLGIPEAGKGRQGRPDQKTAKQQTPLGHERLCSGSGERKDKTGPLLGAEIETVHTEHTVRLVKLVSLETCDTPGLSIPAIRAETVRQSQKRCNAGKNTQQRPQWADIPTPVSGLKTLKPEYHQQQSN